MASTYTPKLNLAKPAHGDVDWHIPINENWDKLDTIVDNAAKTALVSGITVDTDKDWNGKNITNVGTLSVQKLQSSTYTWIPDHGLTRLRYEDLPAVLTYSRAVLKTTPPAGSGVHGLVTVSFTYTGQADGSASAQILINGTVAAGPWSSGTGATGYAQADIPIAPGDVVGIELIPQYSGYVSNLRIHALVVPVLDESLTW